MTGTWRTVDFGDVVELQRGHDLPAATRGDGDVPVIGSFGITGLHNQAAYQGPGVAIGRSGAAIGRATYVQGPYWPLNTCLFVRDFKGNDPRWVFRLLQTIDFAAFNSGSAQPSLNRNFLRGIQVSLPPLAEQQAIGALLGSLDDKIAANSRVTAKSDELAATVWRKSVSSGRSMALSALAEFVNGRNFTNGASGTGRVVVRIAELNSGIGASTVYNDIEVADEHLVRPGDLLFAWSGSLTVARWYRPEAIVNQHIFKVIPRSGFPLWLVNQALRSKLAEFKTIAGNKATTMGHIQRRHLDESVALPTANEVERVDLLMDGLWRSSLSAEMENEALALARDELLPLLMAGKVRVKNAEAMASEAS